MAKLKPATWISSRKKKAKIWLTRLKPDYEYPMNFCDLPPGCYSIRSRRSEYLLEVSKSSLPVKKEKQDYIDLKEFRRAAEKFLDVGWEKLTHDETEGLCHDSHWMKHHPECFSKDEVFIARLVYDKSGVVEQHIKMNAALAGDLYTKDLTNTNEWLVKKLLKVDRWEQF